MRQSLKQMHKVSIDSALKADELLTVLASLSRVDFRRKLVWLRGDVTCLGGGVWNACHSVFDAGSISTIWLPLRIGAVLDEVTSLAAESTTVVAGILLLLGIGELLECRLAVALLFNRV